MQDIIGMPLPPKVSELEKEKACRASASIIGAFLDWHNDTLADDERDELLVQETLHRYFNIDAARCDRERRALLAYQRVLNHITDELKEVGLLEE